MATKKIVVEVEVPEGISEEEAQAYIAKTIRKLKALTKMMNSKEPKQTEEIQKLLREIKRSVAERSR